MTAGLSVLDTAWILEGASEHIGPIAAAYRHFAADPATLSEPVRLSIAPGSAHPLRCDGEDRPWIPGADPTLQLYRTFLLELTRRLGRHALLHAAALVAPDGGAILIAAPSGRGKSTLTLSLLERGFCMLGDDYAPLDLQRAEVQPYPRAIALTRQAEATGPDGAPIATIGTLLGKRLVDPVEVFGAGSLAQTPAPLSRVIVLGSIDRPEPWIRGVGNVEVGLRQVDVDAFTDRLRRVTGVTVEPTGDVGALIRATVRVERGEAWADVAAAIEHPSVLYAEKLWPEPNPFSTEATARPTPRTTAAQLLAREMLNRRSDGRLLEQHGSLAALLFELMGTLQSIPCYQVQPGPRDATADLVTELSVGTTQA